ncbi:L-rhamnose mutarotase [Olivibacter sp. SDN3]|uniref:L-rhamnose mutarotase n=1 Tax=Olivibacter sp. SDN3 TaxID=2764720 RepID=UPI0016511D0F|nr:L-rhamnose mutarotase [Olivibacter sp. SDN3]QNL50584.1 L-rhamnose mutarotase [Olivibacter sp. SDN3]
MKTYALTLDLKDDPDLIAEYERYHQQIWPEVRQSIIDAGILDMRIYRLGNRLFMTMDVADDFSFEEKGKRDSANAKVQEWEALMWKFQQPLPEAKAGEKWLLMEEIFKLTKKSSFIR